MSTLPTARSTASAQRTVRRLVLYSLLFVMVVTGAIGVSGLLGRLFDTGPVIAVGDAGELARSLAFTLIAAPLAVSVALILWRRLAEHAEQSSLAWALYLAGMCTVAVITFTTALLDTAAALIAGDWRPSGLAIGLVWATVWLWHRWMLQHATKAPTRMPGVADILGSAYGLVVGIGGTITALGDLFGEALVRSTTSDTVGDAWWQPALQSLVWAGGGAVLWWWHWMPAGAQRRRTAFSDVAVNGVGVLVPTALTLGGISTAIFVLLRLAFDRTDPTRVLLTPMGLAIAAALVGAMVWLYHHGQVRARSRGAQEAAALIISGVALVFAASGIGVIVNAALGAVATTLAGGDTRTVLLGGIASLVVGAPAWWMFWRRVDIVSAGRRVYLILVFGVSAVVALVALLVIGFFVFEFFLDSVGSSDRLLDRIRAPFGLLIATALASGYHFGVWRRDRALLAASSPERPHTIGRVTLIIAGDPQPAIEAIEHATGAAVTVWARTDAEAAAAGTELEPAAFAEALSGVTGDRVVIVVGPGSRVEAIPVTR